MHSTIVPEFPDTLFIYSSKTTDSEIIELSSLLFRSFSSQNHLFGSQSYQHREDKIRYT